MSLNSPVVVEEVESVQFMQFDNKGNLYVFQAGAGCSGVPRKIEQGFTQEDLDLTQIKSEVPDSTVQQDSKRFTKLPSKNVFRCVPQNGVAAVETRKLRRSVIVLSLH